MITIRRQTEKALGWEEKRFHKKSNLFLSKLLRLGDII